MRADGCGARIEQAEGHKDIQHTDAADDPAHGGMQEDVHQPGKTVQEEVLFPERGPWQVQEQRTHLKQQHDGHGAQNAVHREMRDP